MERGSEGFEYLADLIVVWPKLVEYAGLSEYEAKIYLGLLSLAPIGARRLSLMTHVPRTKVYGTVKKLVEYGLAKVVLGSVKTFIPVHPSEAFASNVALAKGKAQDYEKVITSLSEVFPEKSIRLMTGAVWMIQDKDELMDLLWVKFNPKDYIMHVCVNENAINHTFGWLQKLEKERTVVETNVSQNDLTYSELQEVCTVRYKFVGEGIFFVRCGTRAILVTIQGEVGDEVVQGFYVNDERLAELLAVAVCGSAVPTSGG